MGDERRLEVAVAKLQALSAQVVGGLRELKGCGQTWGVSAAVGCREEMTCSWLREFCRARLFTLCSR